MKRIIMCKIWYKVITLTIFVCLYIFNMTAAVCAAEEDIFYKYLTDSGYVIQQSGTYRYPAEIDRTETFKHPVRINIPMGVIGIEKADFDGNGKDEMLVIVLEKPDNTITVFMLEENGGNITKSNELKYFGERGNMIGITPGYFNGYFEVFVNIVDGKHIIGFLQFITSTYFSDGIGWDLYAYTYENGVFTEILAESKSGSTLTIIDDDVTLESPIGGFMNKINQSAESIGIKDMITIKSAEIRSDADRHYTQSRTEVSSNTASNGNQIVFYYDFKRITDNNPSSQLLCSVEAYYVEETVSENWLKNIWGDAPYTGAIPLIEVIYNIPVYTRIEVLPLNSNLNGINSASNWAKPGIESAVSKGFVPADLQYNYQDTITRAEFCRMAVKYIEYRTGKSIDAVLSEKGVSRDYGAFTDTSDPDILAAYALGVTGGTGDREFTPNGGFTREQAATMIMNVCKVLGINTNAAAPSGFFDINQAAAWARGGIDFCSANGIMSGTGDNMFSPKMFYTREQSIITLGNIETGNIPKTPEINPSADITALLKKIEGHWVDKRYYESDRIDISVIYPFEFAVIAYDVYGVSPGMPRSINPVGWNRNRCS